MHWKPKVWVKQQPREVEGLKLVSVAQWLVRPTGVRELMGSTQLFSLTNAHDKLNIPPF